MECGNEWLVMAFLYLSNPQYATSLERRAWMTLFQQRLGSSTYLRQRDTYRGRVSDSNRRFTSDNNCGSWDFYMICCDVVYSSLDYHGWLGAREQRSTLAFTGKCSFIGIIHSKHFKISYTRITRYTYHSFPSKNCLISITSFHEIVLPIVNSVLGWIYVLLWSCLLSETGKT